MKFSIPVKPLSVNKAYRGRRFKTKDYIDFESDVGKTIGQCQDELPSGELFVIYTFHIKNYGRSDTANMEKVLSDTLKKLGYFRDDSDIKSIYMVKERTKQDERIDVEIHPFEMSTCMNLHA